MLRSSLRRIARQRPSRFPTRAIGDTPHRNEPETDRSPYRRNMSGDVLGGGVVVALAAALWLGYLIPVWLRRREYLATERNAVRLQQTLRILAETSELPEAVRYEATARTVAEQQRILRRAEDRVKADARAAAEADARRERAVAEAERAAAEEAERAA